jgi:ligand-binding sensor domain-containing protein
LLNANQNAGRKMNIRISSFVYNSYKFILFFCFILNATEWESFEQKNNGLVSNKVLAICIDDDGIKWFGTDSGLSAFNGEEWATFLAGEGLERQTINHISEERTESVQKLWLATNDGVLEMIVISFDSLFIKSIFTSSNSGLLSKKVTTTAVDFDTIRWFGTNNGLSSLLDSSWMTYTTQDHLSNNQILSLGMDSLSGWRFIGTKGGGVSRIKYDDVDGITSASPYDYTWSGLLSDSIYAIYIDELGNQWFGTDQGPALHTSYETKKDWVVYTTDHGIVNNFVQTIIKDHKNKLWFGTKGGVSSFDGTTWNNFTVHDGLVNNNVHAIAVDIDGTLWFGTDLGVSHFSNPTNISEQKYPLLKISDYILQQNFPNPFNPVTQISYSLPNSGQVSLNIFDITGQKIATLVNKYQSAGSYQVYFDGTHFPSGILFYRLQIGKQLLTKQMLLLQ